MAGKPKRRTAVKRGPAPAPDVAPDADEDEEHAAVAERAVRPDNVIDLWEKVKADKVWRIAFAKKSPAFFAYCYLKARGKPVATPQCHVDWFTKIGVGAGYRKAPYRQQRSLLLSPRAHGKSHVACWVTPLHRICFNRNIRILMLAEKADSAQKWLRRIRKQLESNKLIIEDFGGETGFRDPQAPWTDHRIQVKREDGSLADPTIEAVGAGGSITGGRFDLIIADDPESDDTVLTAQVRKRTRSWFRATIQELLEPWGETLVIGTVKHMDDLYHHLERDRTYQTIKYKAILGDIPKHEWILNEEGKIVWVKVTEKHPPKVLWPEVWPLEALLFKRESMTSVLFARENQQEVVSDEDAIFHLEWLNAAKERGSQQARWGSSDDVPSGWTVVDGWDPAFVDDPKQAQDADRDYFFGLKVAVNLKNWHRRIIGGFRDRGLEPSKYTAAIRRMAAPFARASDPHHPSGALKYVVVERNSLGKMYEIGIKRDTDLPLVPHSTSKDKADPYEGVDAMASLFENGQISIAMQPPKAEMPPRPGDEADDAEHSAWEDECAQVAKAAAREHERYLQVIEALVGELHGLGSEPHDDGPMSLWMAEIAIRKLRRSIEQRDKSGARPSPPRRSVPRPGKEGPTPAATEIHASVNPDPGSVDGELTDPRQSPANPRQMSPAVPPRAPRPARDAQSLPAAGPPPAPADSDLPPSMGGRPTGWRPSRW